MKNLQLKNKVNKDLLHRMDKLVAESTPKADIRKSAGGRFPGLYTYDIVKNDDKNYAVVTLAHKNEDIKFVINDFNLDKVLSRSWHLSSGKYIATNLILPDGKNKELTLHSFIKDNCFEDKQDKIVTHINNNMFDNRVENLRFVEASEYLSLRNNRKRKIELPPNCGFSVDEIPKYMSFLKAGGEHGDRFSIEIPQINLYLKLTSSKKILLKDKFEEAIRKLNEIYKSNPNIDPDINNSIIEKLNGSLETILLSLG